MDTATYAPVALITVLAVIQTLVFAELVGAARGKYKVPAPRMDGPEEFLRANRIHQNTVEQMVGFVPLLWTSAFMWRADGAAALGLLYLIGRVVYAVGYTKDPKKRTPGFVIGALAMAGLLITTGIGIVQSWL